MAALGDDGLADLDACIALDEMVEPVQAMSLRWPMPSWRQRAMLDSSAKAYNALRQPIGSNG
jgi:hypothetical protein